jgi:hypothetical protein
MSVSASIHTPDYFVCKLKVELSESFFGANQDHLSHIVTLKKRLDAMLENRSSRKRCHQFIEAHALAVASRYDHCNKLHG